MSVKRWKRIEPTTVQKVGWRVITTKTFQMPSGKTEKFQLYDKEGRHFVAVVALTSDNHVVVARQFRPGPEQIMDELPGGFVDAEDENNIVKAGARELEEETGYRAQKITYLGKAYKDAYNNAVWHICLAEGCVQTGSGQQLDQIEIEGVEVRLISIEQLMYNARNGRMTDPDGVLLAYEILREHQNIKQ